MNDPKQLIIRALNNLKGDDLERARMAFRDYTPQKLNDTFYGDSGRTPAQIIKDYEERNALIDEAIEWVKSK